MSDPRYPIGPYIPPAEFDSAFVERSIAAIEALPGELRTAVAGLDGAQLDTPYRDGGWTVRQVTHHLPDSHVNAFVRHRLAMTEDRPTIRPYDEKLWSALPDSRNADPDLSVRLIEALHPRWVAFLRTLEPADLRREFFHPEADQTMTLNWSIGMYAWHGRHHVAHVTSLRRARGW